MFAESDLELVGMSWESAMEERDDRQNPVSEFAKKFYDKVFEIAPEARAMFKGDITEQGAKLMKVLATLVAAVQSNHLDDAQITVVKQMGARHTTYGVVPAHYDVVGQALIFTLRDSCDPDIWDDQIEAIWVKIYTLIADLMKN